MGKVYKNGIVSPKGFDMAAAEPVDQREIVESLNDLITLPQCYPGIEVKVVGELYKEYKLVRLPSGVIENWIEVVPEYNQPAQQTTDTVLNNSNLPGTTTTDALNSLAFGATGTYEEMKAIRDGNRLTPGSRYTITDYQTKYFIEGSNSSGIIRSNTFATTGNWSSLIRGYEYLLTVGQEVEIVSLPDGYQGIHTVGELTTVSDISGSYWFKFANAMDADLGMVGAEFVFYLDRYQNTPNDTVIDSNGKPVIKPQGVINTEAHDGTAYMDMSASQNIAVPTESVVLIAASTNSFQPQGFSGTFLGDAIYYDMDDTEVINDNNQVIGSRNGHIFRRINRLQTVDLPVDWRVRRFRRWLLDQDSRTKFTNQQHPRVTATAGSFIVSEIYDIVTVGDTDFTLIGAADNNVGTRFTATGVGTGTGTAVAESMQMNPNTDLPIFTLDVDHTLEDDRFYVANTLEPELMTMGRWGEREDFTAIAAGPTRAFDYGTIPLKEDGSYDPSDRVSLCVWTGEWKNVIFNEFAPLPTSFYQPIVLEGSGGLTDCQFQSGIQARLNSNMWLVDIISCGGFLASGGFQGIVMKKIQALGPLLFSGATNGSEIQFSIFGTATDPAMPSSDTYSWIFIDNSSSARIYDCVFGTRTGSLSVTNSALRNCCFHLGYAETTAENALVRSETVSFDNSVFINTTMRFLKNSGRPVFNGESTPDENANKVTLPKRYVWDINFAAGYNQLSFNLNNSQLVKRELDVSNVETFSTYIESDDR